MGEKTTVFQSEIFAQKMAATLIINGSTGPNKWVGEEPIIINTDNQATLGALRNVWIKSKLVKETIDLLDKAAQCCPLLTIRWVKAHVEGSVAHKGNAKADDLAKKASR